ncbi:sec-independent protein translocase protein TatC [Pullulanibacillus pueri]|uniref:Sec-independent protein translocase protein TatC n=1 Tax=Pullulanibacillus pueri TaxID=1437324 RepID=A0A8J2ZWC4_9BACL|nr:twin-arginine translocase subunit TatC [Pullulanibacillus pueri]MBM7682831.1 sec-independent protein translocase protein TatC [Pullulanibacillus pueri]GGH83365.1 Sec-independent protein translocase protein TatCy [Pullulanibacillus pueri]
MSDKSMSFSKHFQELRKRFVIIIIGFIVTFIIGFIVAKPVIIYLQHSDTANGIALNGFRITDPINIFMQMAFIIGIVLVSPLIMYQIWAFVSPGLYEHERKVTLSYIPLSLGLFLAGIAFSYFVLFPYVLHFMISLSKSLGITNVIGINEYFRFLLQLTLPFGLIFELPIVVMFLTRLGLITPYFLSKIRKYAYFVLLIIAGIITPPDVISQIIVMIPLVILYELSLIISRRTYKRQLIKEQDLVYAEEE